LLADRGVNLQLLGARTHFGLLLGVSRCSLCSLRLTSLFYRGFRGSHLLRRFHRQTIQCLVHEKFDLLYIGGWDDAGELFTHNFLVKNEEIIGRELLIRLADYWCGTVLPILVKGRNGGQHRLSNVPLLVRDQLVEAIDRFRRSEEIFGLVSDFLSKPKKVKTGFPNGQGFAFASPQFLPISKSDFRPKLRLVVSVSKSFGIVSIFEHKLFLFFCSKSNFCKLESYDIGLRLHVSRELTPEE